MSKDVWPADRPNKYGEPFVDYELAMINGPHAEDAACYLGFRAERFGFRDIQAFWCETCGVLLTDSPTYMRLHRSRCGWSAL